MWTSVPCCTKYEFSLSYKTVYNYVMPYYTALIMIGLKILEELEKKQFNCWPKRNPMVLHKIMINMWTKWAIDLSRKKVQPNKNIGSRPTKYKACQANKISTFTKVAEWPLVSRNRSGDRRSKATLPTITITSKTRKI